jgi:uncharacterized membrane protein
MHSFKHTFTGTCAYHKAADEVLKQFGRWLTSSLSLSLSLSLFDKILVKTSDTLIQWNAIFAIKTAGIT